MCSTVSHFVPCHVGSRDAKDRGQLFSTSAVTVAASPRSCQVNDERMGSFFVCVRQGNFSLDENERSMWDYKRNNSAYRWKIKAWLPHRATKMKECYFSKHLQRRGSNWTLSKEREGKPETIIGIPPITGKFAYFLLTYARVVWKVYKFFVISRRNSLSDITVGTYASSNDRWPLVSRGWPVV